MNHYFYWQRFSIPAKQPNTFLPSFAEEDILSLFSDCFRTVFELEYMGNADFEYGKIPNSWDEFIDNHLSGKNKSFQYTPTFEVGEGNPKANFYYIGEERYVERALIGIEFELFKKTSCKPKADAIFVEPSHILHSLKYPLECKTRAWLDIQAHFMIFNNDEMFERLRIILSSDQEIVPIRIDQSSKPTASIPTKSSFA